MASALFKLSSNGGSSYAAAGVAFADASALAYAASSTYSIKAALDSTAGVDSVTWTITSADDAHIDSLPAITTNADKTCTFSVPKTGGAWLLQCKVNGGVNPRTGKADPDLTRALAIKVLNSAGYQEVAVGETTEAGAYGWTKAFNDVARAGGGGGGGGGNASLRQVYYDEGNLSATDPVYNAFDDAFTAATALLSEANGPVEIVVLNDNDPPEFPVGTFDAQGLIEIVGYKATRDNRVAVTLTDGFVLRNPRALRGLEIQHNVSTPWLTTSAATDLALVLDNCNLYDNGSSADMCTLAASTTNNKLQIIGGTILDGDSYAFTSTASGKSLTVYVDDGAVNAEFLHGSAGSAAISVGSSGSYDSLASYTGTLTVTHGVTTALGQVTASVGFNSQRITSVASPTSGTDAANRNWVDGAASVSVAGSGSISLSTGNVSTGAVALTGALTGDRTATLPSGQRGLWLYNGTSGLYTLRIEGPSGGFCYLLPGQSRRVYVDASGILRGDALYLCETEIDVSLVGIGSGDTTTSLCRLPAKFALERCERMTIVAPDGDGEYNDSVGFTATTYDDILSNNAYPMADTWGLASATDWGSGFTDGYSYSASARTLVYLVNGFNQTVANTVGTVRVRIAGRHFGA